MIQEQQKIKIRDSFIVVDTLLNMKQKSILENILKYLFQEELYKYKISVNFSNVIHISSDTDEYLQEVVIDDKTYNIETLNFLRLLPENIDNKLEFIKNKTSVVIIGNINKMSPDMLDLVTKYFNQHIVLIYGDSAVYTDEYGSSHSTYFTNVKLDVVEQFDLNKFNTDKKKLFNVLMKTRKDPDYSKIANSNIFEVTRSKDIDTLDIADLLNNPDNCVVVPQKYFNTLNSKMRYLISGTSSLLPTLNDKFYTSHPIIIEDEIGQKDFIKPFTEVLVINLSKDTDIYMTAEGDLVCSLNLCINGKNYYNVPFDLGYFISNFDHNEHPDHTEVFEHLTKMLDYKQKFNYSFLKCVPFKILEPNLVKYASFNIYNVYTRIIESESLESLVSQSIYKSISTVKEKLRIVESYEFEII
ncbi:MAG: hypothetical protein ACRC92_27105 [Peptostreptococcaceae bacterium]